MGTTSHHPSEALFTKTQRRVLGLLFGHPHRSHYANEIVRAAGVGIGAVLRELDSLVSSGLVVMVRVGNQKHFQANRASPVFTELAGIARKILTVDETGAAGRFPMAAENRVPYAILPVAEIDVPGAGLSRLCRKYGIRKISLFGSAARNELKSGSDIDLLVEFDPGSKASLFDYPALRQELSGLFGNRVIDIVPPGALRNPHRRKAMLADLTVLHEAR